MASLNSAYHTQHMEGAEHRKKATENKLPPQLAVRDISALAGGSGIGIAAGQAASRTSGGMATEALAMLSDKRVAQNKKQKYITSRGMKHNSAIW